MIHEKKMTVLNPSVAAEGEQPFTDYNISIPDGLDKINSETVNSEGCPQGRKRGTMNNIMNTIIQKNEPTIIAVDHGFGNIKTAHCCFRTGVTAYEKKPIFTNEMLVYNEKYYIIGEEHKEFVPDKMSDPDYYILTLAAIARELYLQRCTSARVYLAVGLPLTWVGEQRKEFKAYLLQNETADFNYKGTDYHVEFAGASVYPQGFAAIAGSIRRFQGMHMLCDIGNGTMNVMRINDGKAVQTECYTEQYGTRQCILAIRESLMQKCHVKLDEPIIERVLRFKTADISQRILDVITEGTTIYAEGIMRKLREHDYNSEIMRLYVMGGGGCLIKNFGSYDPDRVTFNEDIHASAIGYEACARHELERIKAGARK